MSRDRSARLLVATGLSVAVAATMVFGLLWLVLTPGVVSSASPNLLRTPELRQPLAEELASNIPALYPPGVVDPATASAVGERLVRDSGMIAEVTRAMGEAHQAWRAGEPPLLELDPLVVTPATLAALRDVDIELSRSFPETALVQPKAIEVPVAVASSKLERLRGFAVGLFVIGVFTAVVGGFRWRRLNLFLITTGNALLGSAAAVAAVVLGLQFLNLRSFGWPWSAIGALLGAARTPLLVISLLVAGLAVFLRATATQVATSRPKPGPSRKPAKSFGSGPTVSRWRKRDVRQEAIEAFFEEGKDREPQVIEAAPQGAEPRVGPEGKRVPAPYTTVSVEGFEGAIATVDHDPSPGEPKPHDRLDSEPGDPAEFQAAEQLAADRKAALERIDGTRSGVRTHLRR